MDLLFGGAYLCGDISDCVRVEGVSTHAGTPCSKHPLRRQVQFLADTEEEGRRWLHIALCHSGEERYTMVKEQLQHTSRYWSDTDITSI